MSEIDDEAVGSPTGVQVPLWREAVVLGLGLAAYYTFPDDLAFLTNVLVTALFVLSLSLVLGQAGIATLGHAAYFGIGGYAAGLFAIPTLRDPIAGLLVAGSAGGVAELLSGLVLLRTQGLTFLMLSVAFVQICHEVANRAARITGGDDGLSGIVPGPLLGAFEFDLYGRTAYLYALGVLVISYLLLRKICDAPFGLTCRGIRSDRLRISALGGNVYLHLLAVFSLGGVFAGFAGALSAQSAGVAGLSDLSFAFSGNALVMLVLGGVRKLHGALVGTVVFMVIQHVAATINPYHWLFIIGAMLIGSVLVLPTGIVGLADTVAISVRRRVQRRGREP